MKIKEIIGLSSYCITILMIVFMMLSIFHACIYGSWPIEEIINEGQPEELVDSCQLTDIDNPNFRAIWSIGRIDTIPKYAVVEWNGYSSDWIQDYQEVKPLNQAVREVVSTFITFDSMIMIDHTGIVGNQLVIDFWYAFRSPGGSWNQGVTPLQIKLPGYVSSWQLVVSTENKEMRIGTIANYSAQEVVDAIEALSSWQRFRMKFTNLSQDDKAIIYDALLSNCKCCVRLDTQTLNIPIEYVEQFNYQNIIMQ